MKRSQTAAARPEVSSMVGALTGHVVITYFTDGMRLVVILTHPIRHSDASFRAVQLRTSGDEIVAGHSGDLCTVRGDVTIADVVRYWRAALDHARLYRDSDPTAWKAFSLTERPLQEEEAQILRRR